MYKRKQEEEEEARTMPEPDQISTFRHTQFERNGPTLFADASDLALKPGTWPEFVIVLYGQVTNVFSRVGFDYDTDGQIRAARYGNRIGQALLIYND